MEVIDAEEGGDTNTGSNKFGVRNTPRPRISGEIEVIGETLADDMIEPREGTLVTAYSNVACPNTGEIWYTFGVYPAANKKNWQR